MEGIFEGRQTMVAANLGKVAGTQIEVEYVPSVQNIDVA
jgi:hypothetical protein